MAWKYWTIQYCDCKYWTIQTPMLAKTIRSKCVPMEKIRNASIAGCNCPLCHLAAGAGGKAFDEECGFEIDEHQVDLYYFFKGSFKRKEISIESLSFVNLE